MVRRDHFGREPYPWEQGAAGARVAARCLPARSRTPAMVESDEARMATRVRRRKSEDSVAYSHARRHPIPRNEKARGGCRREPVELAAMMSVCR
jgi:hypothetical protein